jgi:hypothetical protein
MSMVRAWSRLSMPRRDANDVVSSAFYFVGLIHVAERSQTLDDVGRHLDLVALGSGVLRR